MIQVVAKSGSRGARTEVRPTMYKIKPEGLPPRVASEIWLGNIKSPSAGYQPVLRVSVIMSE